MRRRTTLSARTDAGESAPWRDHTVAVGLNAVVVAVTSDAPRVIIIRSNGDAPDALPSGPLEARHRTLEMGLRAWVEAQTREALGYVEQLYSFGDRGRQPVGARPRSRMLSIGYLALVREARPAGSSAAAWH